MNKKVDGAGYLERHLEWSSFLDNKLGKHRLAKRILLKPMTVGVETE